MSAQASEIIAVDDLYYNNKLNPALAIFTLLASQLLGYGFAGYVVFLRAAFVANSVRLGFCGTFWSILRRFVFGWISWVKKDADG